SESPGSSAPSAPLYPPMLPPDAAPVDDRPVLPRLLDAARQLIVSPGRAFNGGLDVFFNTPGAVGAIVVFFLLSVGVSTAAAWFSTPRGAGAAAVLMMLASVVNVVATAGTIAVFNQ